MAAEQGDPAPPRSGANRRQFLLGGAAAGIGLAAAGMGYGVAELRQAGRQLEPDPLLGEQTIPFFGTHQAGISTPVQAHATYLGLDLLPGADRAQLVQMMSLLTDDAARLTQGRPALADTEPEMAKNPARLTVTFGFGPGFVQRAAGSTPDWLAPLPAFSIDALEDDLSGGDLLIHVAADDPMSVAHTVRMLLKDTRSFAGLRWFQQGFRRAYSSDAPGTPMRNLFGQVDETVNPEPGTEDFDRVVWMREGWLAGGTSLVLRRIAMNLDTWDKLDRPGREKAVGRFLSNGAPLTGTKERDEPDFEATSPIGFPIIPEFSHMRRARSENPKERIYRRSYNYDDAPAPAAASVSHSGLIFAGYQADLLAQFLPIQRRLDELDLLNEWTTPVGSSVFAIPPGCREGGFIGETLLA